MNDSICPENCELSPNQFEADHCEADYHERIQCQFRRERIRFEEIRNDNDKFKEYREMLKREEESLRKHRDIICREPSHVFCQDKTEITPEGVAPLNITVIVKMLTCHEQDPAETQYLNIEIDHEKIMSQKTCFELTGLGLSYASTFPVYIHTKYFDIDNIDKFKQIFSPGSILLVSGEYRISMKDSEVFIICPDVTLLPEKTIENLSKAFDEWAD